MRSRSTRGIVCLIAFVLIAVALAPALAQDRVGSMSGAEAEQETLKYLGYMAAAYGIIWAAALLYFISLGKKEKEIWTELEDLRKSVEREGGES